MDTSIHDVRMETIRAAAAVVVSVMDRCQRHPTVYLKAEEQRMYDNALRLLADAFKEGYSDDC